MRVTVILTSVLVLLLALPAVVLAASSTYYELPILSNSGGGGEMVSSNFRLSDRIGELVVGEMSNSGLSIKTGYRYGTRGVTPGDANDDGMVNALDITKIERIIVGLDTLTSGADTNLDIDVNALDITRLERIIVGLD